MTVTVQDPITVQDPMPRHLLTYVVAAVAAVVLAISLVVGFSIADSDSSPTVSDTGSSSVVQELPSRFSEGRSGSPGALDDAASRYGSPDAAEEYNR
ncbi:MAG: hypothetical protein H0U89_11680 [Acidimicrobiia bacterium]|nr:hypothetical protein [Acidimicrobiia bacterium]